MIVGVMRLKTNIEGSTRLTYTGLLGGLEHAISRTLRNILRYSSIGITDTGIVPDTGVI
jgi:hypothetical protein